MARVAHFRRRFAAWRVGGSARTAGGGRRRQPFPLNMGARRPATRVGLVSGPAVQYSPGIGEAMRLVWWRSCLGRRRARDYGRVRVRLRCASQPTSPPSTIPASGANGTSVVTRTTMPTAKPSRAPSAIVVTRLTCVSLCVAPGTTATADGRDGGHGVQRERCGVDRPAATMSAFAPATLSDMDTRLKHRKLSRVLLVCPASSISAEMSSKRRGARTTRGLLVSL